MSSRRSPRRSRGSVAITTELRTTSAEQTEAAGERLAAALGPGDVVALVGELGAGKTCFIQGVVRGLGATTRATSPTFVLINQYRRSEEHTSELQSQSNLVCRLLLEKKKQTQHNVEQK